MSLLKYVKPSGGPLPDLQGAKKQIVKRRINAYSPVANSSNFPVRYDMLCIFYVPFFQGNFITITKISGYVIYTQVASGQIGPLRTFQLSPTAYLGAPTDVNEFLDTDGQVSTLNGLLQGHGGSPPFTPNLIHFEKGNSIQTGRWPIPLENEPGANAMIGNLQTYVWATDVLADRGAMPAINDTMEVYLDLEYEYEIYN